MERCCGDLGCHISNSRNVYANMDQRLLSKSIIYHLTNKYGIDNMLRPNQGVSGDENSAKDSEKLLPNYPHYAISSQSNESS